MPETVSSPDSTRSINSQASTTFLPQEIFGKEIIYVSKPTIVESLSNENGFDVQPDPDLMRRFLVEGDVVNSKSGGHILTRMYAGQVLRKNRSRLDNFDVYEKMYRKRIWREASM